MSASGFLIPQMAACRFSSSEISKIAAALFSAYASFVGSMMLVRSMANELFPHQLRSYLFSTFRQLFTPLSPNLTLAIDEIRDMMKNQVYEAAELYLSTRISPKAERLKVSKTRKQKRFKIALEKGETVVDHFEGVQLTWRFVCMEGQKPHSGEERLFELSFKKKHKEKVLNSYLPYVLLKAEEIQNQDRAIKLYSHQCPFSEDDDERRGSWGSITLDHPATFDTLAMDLYLKKMILDDLKRFLGGKEYYKKVGKAWKRGYLLYGPPGTGKSSLVAAMANYLKFDIYDLRLTSVRSDDELRRTLLSTSNRSILLIEDIDCSSEVLERKTGNKNKQAKAGQLTLPGILNCIDGLWSSCGDERIIVFTTNNKDRLDPALLRPGRMDLHINMSYCTTDGFKVLASNHLGIDIERSSFFGEIDGLLRSTVVTPAEVAEELMKNDEADADAALQGFANFLKRKRNETDEIKNKAKESGEVLSAIRRLNEVVSRVKRSKTEGDGKKIMAMNRRRMVKGRSGLRRI